MDKSLIRLRLAKVPSCEEIISALLMRPRRCCAIVTHGGAQISLVRSVWLTVGSDDGLLMFPLAYGRIFHRIKVHVSMRRLGCTAVNYGDNVLQ